MPLKVEIPVQKACSRETPGVWAVSVTAADIEYEDIDLAAILRNIAEPYASITEQTELNLNLEIERDSDKIKEGVVQSGNLIQAD